MARLKTDQDIKDVKKNSPKRFKKIISDVTNFIIHDKSGDYAVTLSEEYFEKNGIGKINENFGGIANGFGPEIVEFTKSYVNTSEDISEENYDDNNNEADMKSQSYGRKYIAVKKKYSKYKKSGDNESFAEIFDSVKSIRPEPIGTNTDKADKEQKGDTKTAISAPIASAEEPEKISGKINFANIIKRIFILIFAVVCGSVSLPFAQVAFVINPFGIALISAADKYIFYIYSGLVISLIFSGGNPVVFWGIYTIVAGVKFYLKYSKERAKAEMLSESVSYNNLSKKEKIKLLNLIHFNDTGSVIMSILVCAISCCVVGFLSIILRTESIIYTDIAAVMLFALVAMLFAYLFSGLFDVGRDNKTLEKAGICAVIFTVIYFLAPFYVYTLSIGYIAAFVLTFIAANSGVNKIGKLREVKETDAEILPPPVSSADDPFQKAAYEENTRQDINSDEEIISRFAVNLMNDNGILSDMTRGALVGLLCGIALGDTAGAVTLGICGLVSGLFFSQSTALAIISGIISAASYAVYIAGMDAVQRYIPNMLAGLTFYIPAALFYASVMRKIGAGQYSKKTSPLLDRGLLITELPANKLNTLSDAFHGLSGIFHEISERFKSPNAGETRAIVSACIEKTCGKCDNYESCSLLEKSILAGMYKKCSDFLVKNGRLTSAGIPHIFIDECARIKEIQNKINAVYCSKTEEHIENNKTKIFADNYENIAKLLQNNIKAGKQDIAFKKDLSEKIYLCLESMGIECENVIVMGERKKTVYIFGIKMVNYSGTITDITEMLERICGTCFDHPEYILRDNYVIMKNQSRNKFRIFSMQMSKAASEIKTLEAAENTETPNEPNELNELNGPNETAEAIESVRTDELTKVSAVNGDSVSVFQSGEGFHYGLISDGMGSGKSAALSSRLTVLLTEKLLAAGNQKDLTIEMINSLLISKSDECFSSVDLFEADLITGKAAFVKAGAAPSFVVRNGKLFKIQSSTVPAGIIESINSEQTKFEMEDGDYVLMLSDGIISTFEEGAWLLEMLGDEVNLRDPKMLLNRIFREAARKNSRKDDMSILFMKIVNSA